MQRKYLSPVKGNSTFTVQIGPTPQLKGHVKSILDINTPTPKKSSTEKITKQLKFEDSPEKKEQLEITKEHIEVIPFSPIKLLKNISVKNSLASNIGTPSSSLDKGILQENSTDDTDNEDESGLLFLKKKVSIKPNVKILQELDKEEVGDLNNDSQQVPKAATDESIPDYSNETVIGRPVQGYWKRKLLEMHPNIKLQEHEDMKNEFNEKFNNLEDIKKQKQEGNYYPDTRYKGTLTDDVLPDINSKKKRKYNVVSENYVKLNLKRKKFKKTKK
ncbi:hypothetical protein ACO0R3_001535 [Hanseniaspora guilliermondii]